MQFNSIKLQFKIVYICARERKPTCALSSLSEVFPVLPFRQFQCWSDWWCPFSSFRGRWSSASSFHNSPSTQWVHVYSVTYTPGSICRLCPARSGVILVCIVLLNICREWNTDRIFVTFPTQFVMLQKLIELSLSIHMQLCFWVLSFLTLCRRCCSAAPW